MRADSKAGSIQTIHTTTAEATRELGAKLATLLKPGDLVLLRGELGAGKTTFVQGVAAGLGVRETANSPTFVLIVEHNDAHIPLLHLDAYRLEGAMGEPVCYDALCDAGVLDFLDRTDAVKLVEWPERLCEVLSQPRFDITIQHGPQENERRIEIVEYENSQS
jgi:tRNA threonylcarbamoyladenosine biosynthesis protein TsaE